MEVVRDPHNFNCENIYELMKNLDPPLLLHSFLNTWTLHTGYYHTPHYCINFKVRFVTFEVVPLAVFTHVPVDLPTSEETLEVIFC
jgi:hypothetical protein